MLGIFDCGKLWPDRDFSMSLATGAAPVVRYLIWDFFNEMLYHRPQCTYMRKNNVTAYCIVCIHVFL